MACIDADELLALLELEDEFGLCSRERLAPQQAAALPAAEAAEPKYSTSEYRA